MRRMARNGVSLEGVEYQLWRRLVAKVRLCRRGFYLTNQAKRILGRRIAGEANSVGETMAEIQFEDRAIVVDAEVIGKALGVDRLLVQQFMREGRITSLSERGTDNDAGTYRLTFFYGNRRARLIVSEQGLILRRSSIDFGNHAIPGMMHRPGL